MKTNLNRPGAEVKKSRESEQAETSNLADKMA
jgi:hypothetical protein